MSVKTDTFFFVLFVLFQKKKLQGGEEEKLDLQSKLTFESHIELGTVSTGFGTENLSYFQFISALSCVSKIL